MPDGQWYWSTELNATWSNYSRCYRDQLVTVLMDLPDVQTDNVTSIEVRVIIMLRSFLTDC